VYYSYRLVNQFNNPELIEVCRASSLTELSAVNALIPDWEFDLDNLKIDNAAGVIEIDFKREFFEERVIEPGWLIKNITLPVYDCRLTIRGVISHEIIDTEKIQFYPFDWIEYHPDSGLLEIRSGVPLKFEMYVSRDDVSIYKIGPPVDYKSERVLAI